MCTVDSCLVCCPGCTFPTARVSVHCARKWRCNVSSLHLLFCLTSASFHHVRVQLSCAVLLFSAGPQTRATHMATRHNACTRCVVCPRVSPPRRVLYMLYLPIIDSAHACTTNHATRKAKAFQARQLAHIRKRIARLVLLYYVGPRVTTHSRHFLLRLVHA